MKGAGREPAPRQVLDGVHAEIEGVLAAVPAERRLLVTNHDTLGSFAARYGDRGLAARITADSRRRSSASRHTG